MSARGTKLPEKRKLATILSLDVVGYSAAAEQDDSAAAEGVRTLRTAIDEIVAPFDGRIFSSAGDGFMVEFPVATAGVRAAMALLAACKSPTRPLPQIRIGMHLGEVIVEDNGDLLGHGVNIAARLQQRTNAGAMTVSQDVRHSVRGEPAELLRPMGTIKLDKMSEKIAIYGFGSGAILRRSWPPGARSALIGAGVLALATLGAWAMISFTPPPASARTAVFTLQTPSGDEPAQTLAGGIANEIVDAMTEIGLEPLSRSQTGTPAGGDRVERAKALHAAYALDGDIVRDGAIVRVSVRLDDVATHETVWAKTFERDSAHMGALRLEVAATVVEVVRCASDARGEPALSRAPVSILLRVCEMTNQTGGDAEYLSLAQQLAQAAPHSSLAQSRLALGNLMASEAAPAVLQAQLEQQATVAVDAALRLNPNNGTAGMVKAVLLAPHQTRLQQEGTLLAFLHRSPNNSELNTAYARFLRDVGRNREAVAYLERASAHDPLSPFDAGMLAWGLAIVGRQNDAQALLDRSVARWPESEDIAWARLRVALWFGTRGDALSALADGQLFLDGDDRVCWRTAIDGMAATDAPARRRAASQVRRCLVGPDQTFQVLASLGDTNGAFQLAEAMIAERGEQAYSVMYFVPAARAVRRDARFMPLMQRAGLTQYWLQSNHWPDFCAEPQLPYQCRTEAARLSGGR